VAVELSFPDDNLDTVSMAYFSALSPIPSVERCGGL
jgi:hypothetical protein